MRYDIGLIVPSYGQWDYVRKTVDSFFEHTPGNNVVYVIDDTSPDWHRSTFDSWPPHIITPDGYGKNDLLSAGHKDIDPNATGNERILIHHFAKHSGLTRSWNMGLRLGGLTKQWGAEYTICGNSDILFTPEWWPPLKKALARGYDLVGPVTNASGRVFQQNVIKFVRGYRLTDEPNYLDNVAKTLRKKYVDQVMRVWRINGFFMAAKSSTWWAGAFDADHVIDPAEKMDNGAYELQKRWRKQRRNIGLVTSSFIWHYRSVSRGTRGMKGECGRGAYRPPDR